MCLFVFFCVYMQFDLWYRDKYLRRDLCEVDAQLGLLEEEKRGGGSEVGRRSSIEGLERRREYLINQLKINDHRRVCKKEG